MSQQTNVPDLTETRPPENGPKDKYPPAYVEPEPILDASCEFEKADRGEGMAVDDVKTYHRTER